MKIFKQMLVIMGFISIFLLLGLGGGYLLLDDTTVIALLTKQIKAATGTQITHGKNASITRTLSPMLTMENLKIEGSNNLQIHSSLFQFQINLPGLLRGKLEILKMVLGDTQVNVGSSDEPSQFNLPQSFPLRPILHNIQISQISIVSENGEMSLPESGINHLAVTVEPEINKLVCKLQTQVGKNMLDIVATFPRIQAILEQRHLPFSLTIMNPSFNLSSKGQVDFRLSPPSIEADVQAEASNLDQIPGIIQGHAQIKSKEGVSFLEDIVIKTKNAKGIDFDLTGRIANLFALTGFDLGGNAQLANPTWLAAILPENFDPIRQVTLSTRISGAYPNLAVQKCKLDATTVNALNLNVMGQLALTNDSASLQVKNLDFKLKFSAPDTHSARALFFDTVPEFGAVQG